MTCCFFAALFVLVCPSLSKPSFAQSVILQQPVNGPLTSDFGPRTSPTAGASSNHKGQDIAVPNSTPIPVTGTLVACDNTNGGAGIMATIDHGCCTLERYLHLESCSGGAVLSDSTGVGTGAHLHWEVHVKGVKVDPMFTIGKNLCDPAIQEQVIQDAYSKLPASEIGGGGGSTGDCTAPKPQQQPVDSVESVPTGSVNPVTGVVNTGPPIIITRTVDGRTIIDLDIDPYNPPPPLPPSVTDGFTQPVDTNNEVTGCATDTWTAMVNQSVLQTRREMAMNQRYIAKPDSVLAYACLGVDLQAAGNSIGPVFSESTAWANKQISILNGQTVTTDVSMGEGSLDGALGNAANHLAQSYITGLFSHGFLGGTAGEAPLPPQVTSGSGGSDADFPIHQPIDSCAVMASVWNAAKCGNITDSIPFPRFQEMIGTDPRQYPRILACQDSGISQGMIDTAQGANVAFDEIETHLSILNPPLVGASERCAPPIPTGITIQRRRGAGILSSLINYQDAVCPTPGCTYQNTGIAGTGMFRPLGTCE